MLNQDHNREERSNGAPKRTPRSDSLTRIRRLKKQIKMLSHYRSDSLRHRAGDVEVAVESIIFEQLVRKAELASDGTSVLSSTETIQAILEGVQSAVHELAEQRDSCQNQQALLAQQRELLAELSQRVSPHQDQNIHPASHDAFVEQMEHDLVVSQLEALRKEYDSLVEFVENEKAKPATSSGADDSSGEGRSEEAYLALQQQVAELTDELEKARQTSPLESIIREESHDAESQTLINSLRDQLLSERQQTVELRLELEDVNAALASRSNIPAAERSATLTWEEQKKRLLAHLEDESNTIQIDPTKSLEIHEIIAKTHNEIERRDKEINELKRLLSEQSTASQSMAIGAAAVAELLNHDDLINEERENLRQLQEQWQAKLREAEVEVSIERAKLARQRSELEERFKELEREHNRTLAQENDPPNNGSRWLSRLGLGEQKQ